MTNSTRTSFPATSTRPPGWSACPPTTTRPSATNLVSQTDLVWEGRTGGIRHTLLVGFELGRQDTVNRRRNGFFQPADTATILVPAASPTIDADLIFRPVNTNAARTPANFNESDATVAAVYVQDQLHLSNAVEIVAGLRARPLRARRDKPQYRPVLRAHGHACLAPPGPDRPPGAQPVALRQLQPLLPAERGRPVYLARPHLGGAEAGTLRQLRDRREVGAGARPAGQLRRLPARSLEHPCGRAPCRGRSC